MAAVREEKDRLHSSVDDKSTLAGQDHWREIPRQDLPNWNEQLLQTSASVFQYPYWCEPFRRMHFSPRYLVYGPPHEPKLYVCILMTGIPGLRIGLIQRGPVSLVPGSDASRAALQDLSRWARRKGFIFLRFSHSDQEVLRQVGELDSAETADPFPFYRDANEELWVEHAGEDAQTMISFQPVARRKIKKATKAGYRLEFDDSPETFVQVWPLFQALSTRKNFRYRPLASYLELIRLGYPHKCVRIYTAHLGSKLAEAILIIRDSTAAYCISGALDMDAIKDVASPSCLLHWSAMRDFFHEGIKYYSLGTRSGAVYQFKRQFRPIIKNHPLPVTLVLNRPAYVLWSKLVLRFGPSIWPHVKRLLSR